MAVLDVVVVVVVVVVANVTNATASAGIIYYYRVHAHHPRSVPHWHNN